MTNNTKILFVDDDELNLELFKLNFADKYTIITAATGTQGLELLQKHTDVRLLISDYNMPGMNGLQLAEEAKQNKPLIPCFILTGDDFNDKIDEAVSHKKIQQYFRKPIEYIEVEHAIEAAIRS